MFSQRLVLHVTFSICFAVLSIVKKKTKSRTLTFLLLLKLSIANDDSKFLATSLQWKSLYQKVFTKYLDLWLNFPESSFFPNNTQQKFTVVKTMCVGYNFITVGSLRSRIFSNSGMKFWKPDLNVWFFCKVFCRFQQHCS